MKVYMNEGALQAYEASCHCAVGGHDGHTEGDDSVEAELSSQRCWLAAHMRGLEGILTWAMDLRDQHDYQIYVNRRGAAPAMGTPYTVERACECKLCLALDDLGKAWVVER